VRLVFSIHPKRGLSSQDLRRVAARKPCTSVR
jgi:hypothetical protein